MVQRGSQRGVKGESKALLGWWMAESIAWRRERCRVVFFGLLALCGSEENEEEEEERDGMGCVT